MDKLKPCPCGKTPTELGISHNGQGSKWAVTMGNCCGAWEVEFRTQYHAHDNPKCVALAVEAWNDAPRNDCPDFQEKDNG